MACQSKEKSSNFFQSEIERAEEELRVLLLRLRELRREGHILEQEEFIRRQLLTFLPEMDNRIEVT
jgi:hypothetical protein